MLRSVEFDNQHSLSTNKICDKAAERNLPAEFEAVQAPALEFVPKPIFRIGFLPAKVSRLLRLAWQAF